MHLLTDPGVPPCCGRNEFYRTDMLMAPTQDLRKSPAQVEVSAAGQEGKEDEEDEEEEGGRPERKMPPKRAASKYDDVGIVASSITLYFSLLK